MNEPMTDERLAELRRLAAAFRTINELESIRNSHKIHNPRENTNVR